jgi:hypothetical protein
MAICTMDPEFNPNSPRYDETGKVTRAKEKEARLRAREERSRANVDDLIKDRAALKQVLNALAEIVRSDSRDWSLDPHDAALYGILAGWQRPTLREVAALHNWNPWMRADIAKWNDTVEKLLNDDKRERAMKLRRKKRRGRR